MLILGYKRWVDKIDKNQYVELLIEQYGKLVFSICFNITKNYFEAEDIAQDTFLLAYKNLDSFDGNNPKAWISKIATNKSLDYIKSAHAKRFVPTENDYFLDIKSSFATPETEFMENETKAQILILCKKLKSPYQETATDYFYHEMKAAEICKKTGINLKTIQTQIYRAKKMMKKLWREEF